MAQIAAQFSTPEEFANALAVDLNRELTKLPFTKPADPAQTSQRLRIQAIVFAPALPDQAHVPRMRHDHLMPEFVQ
jgi:hypothetical protein